MNWQLWVCVVGLHFIVATAAYLYITKGKGGFPHPRLVASACFFWEVSMVVIFVALAVDMFLTMVRGRGL